MSFWMSSRAAFVAATLMVLSVSGCGSVASNAKHSPSPDVEAPSDEGSSPLVSGSPDEPAEEPAPLTVNIPPCEELVPTDVLHNQLGTNFQYSPEASQAQSYLMAAIGPSAQAAIKQASQSLYCSWGIPQSDSGTSVLVSDVPEQARSKFLSALRDSDFIETEVAGFPAFVWESDAKLGPRYLWYGFTDQFLVSSLALTPDGSLGKIVVSSLAQANQDLA